MLRRLGVIVCCAAFAACAGAPADYEGGDPIGPSVRDQMSGPQLFEVAASAVDGGSFVSAEVAGGLAGEPQLVALPVTGGVVSTRSDADGRLQVEELVVQLADVVLTEEQFPPAGLWLSGMQLRAARPAVGDAIWTEDEESAVARAELDLLFDWGVVLSDGEVHPLATQTVRDVSFAIDIGRSGPVGLTLGLGAYADGVVWRWSTFVEVSNLGIDLVAVD